MVKRPRQVKRYSPSAGKHTLHTVERVKKRRASEQKWGQRRFRRVTAGYRVQNPKVVKSLQSESTFYTVVLRPVRHTMRLASGRRDSN